MRLHTVWLFIQCTKCCVPPCINCVLAARNAKQPAHSRRRLQRRACDWPTVLAGRPRAPHAQRCTVHAHFRKP